ncbi:MAG: histidinol dehydrogenase [Rhodothermales bacterium]
MAEDNTFDTMPLNVVINPARNTWPELVRRPGGDLADALQAVRPILDDVRRRGDAAVREYTNRFDGVDVADVRVDPFLAARATAELNDDLVAAIAVAERNIHAFHAAQAEGTIELETTKGVRVWRRSVPIERVGIYVPGGTAPLFSTVLMLAIPARIAGCEEIVLCTPPREDGTIHPAILHAANVAGVTHVCAVGGAQAIAALAYGTDTVPRVDKIFGPGNRYVTAAKQLVAAEGIATDLPAGPTEVAILVDETSNPVFVAADMLAQAEHGADSHVFVVSVGDAIVAELQTEIERQLADLPRADTARAALKGSTLVVVDTLDEALALSDAYAPEHLIVLTRSPEFVAARIRHAGSVFVGPWTPESLGDYASGTNHTLPTGGAARAWSGVSLDSFVRKITFQQASQAGLGRLGPHVVTMAEAEHLSGHGRAVSVRTDAIQLDADRRNAGESIETPNRTGFVRRTTAETDILVHVDLDGAGRAHTESGLAFLDHMLDQIARHSGIDLTIRCDGDLHIDEHHTMEDTAIVLGQALHRALGDKRGIGRYGFTAPMDDALASVALDLSGRAWLVWNVPFERERIGDVPTEMFEHFFKSLSDAAAMNLNIQASGDNEHHVIESVFKAFARALGDAVRRTGSNALPSTKGAL